MSSLFCLSTALLGLLSTAVSASSHRLHARQNWHNCTTTGVHILAIPGEGQYRGDLSLLAPLNQAILDAIPGSDFDQVFYPLPQNSTDGERITVVGAKTLHKKLKRYRRDCPDSKIVIIGYSAGAVIAMNTLCGQSAPYEPTTALPSSYTDNIIATVAYGEQTYEPNQSYDRGNCTTGVGRVGRADTASCAPFAPAMHSYCNNLDPQCCTGGSNPTDGTNPNAHFGYSYYDNLATDFVVRKFKHAVKKQEHHAS